MPKLTKTLVENTPIPDTGDNWVWDSELEGFGIRAMASGRKTYVVRYRVKGIRTQRKMTLARCTDIPPEKARELARKVFAQVAEGKDPVGDKRVQQEAPTLTQLRDRYMAEHAKPFKKEGSVELDEKNWRLHIIPNMGEGKEVATVKRSDILALHGKLAETPATANQVLALLSKAFNLSEDWEWRPRNTNPCHKVKKFELNERETILSLAQIQRLHEALAELVAEQLITFPMAALVRLLLLTGCRLREIMNAKRPWIDRERSLLLLPDSKVGHRKIPLPGPCFDIIDAPELGDGEWLIPARDGSAPLADPYRMWERIKARAELPENLRIHDLRHTAGSLAHQAGLSQKQIAILLGHKQLSTTERYLHGMAGENDNVATKLSNVITGAWGNAA